MKRYIYGKMMSLALLLCTLCLLVSCDSSISKEKEQYLIEKAKEGNQEARFIIVTSRDNNVFKDVDQAMRDKYLDELLAQNYVPVFDWKASWARVKSEKNEEMKWLERAAKLGSESAMYKLSIVYREKKDTINADKWLRRSATLGYPSALREQRKIDKIKPGVFDELAEKFRYEMKKTKGTWLAKWVIVMTDVGKNLFLSGLIGILVSFFKGLLVLLGLLAFIGVFFWTLVISLPDMNLKPKFPIWLVWLYTGYGTILGVLNGLIVNSSDILLNIGRLWLAEGTFGGIAKFVVGMSWVMLLATGYILVKCIHEKTWFRLFGVIVLCIYGFVIGVSLAFVVFILLIIFLGKSCNSLTALMSSFAGGDSGESNSSGYNEMINPVDSTPRQARDIGVIPGNKYEDEQGVIWEKGEDGRLHKRQ